MNPMGQKRLVVILSQSWKQPRWLHGSGDGHQDDGSAAQAGRSLV